jgi:RHS repeat-associated protein
MTDVLGNEIRYEYDGQRLISEINARGIKQMVNTYDSAGRVIEQRFADGGEWRYEYTLSNASVPSSPVRETAVTDPLGQKTVYRFNINGFLISVVDALGQTTSFERASESNLLIRKRGNAVCAVCGDASIEVTEYEYDDLGNTRKIRQLNDSLDRSLAVVHSEVSMTFGGAFNKLQSVTDPLGNSFTLDYDFEGNVSQTEDALGRKSYFNHDSQGLLQSVTDALGNKTSYRYDTFSNLISEADAEGNENVIRYDGVSRPVEIVDALGNSTVLQYDAAGRVNSLTNANDETIRFEYDSLGNRTAVIDARGLRTSFEYNTMNRVSKRTDSLGNSDLREYDLVGNLIHYTDREGQKSSYEYDALYRLSKVTYADGESTQYAYSTRSQLVEVVDSSSGVYQYQYDARGMLSEVLTPTGKVSYSYNRRGDMISRQVQGQEAVAYDYDAVGNLTRVSSGGVWLQFQYDELNQVVSVSRSNNVDTNYSYTNRGQISSISHTSFGREISKQEYIYDSVGNRIQYDTLLLSPQLTAAATYDIDPASNRLLRRGDVLYSYDKNGNRSREENIKTGEAKSYEWDARNRLIALIESGGESTAFSYDFAGNLIRKTRTTPEATREITYVLDVYSNIVAVIDSDGDSFGVLTGQTLDSHLAILRESKQQFPLVDAINSTVATTNEMGVIEAEFHYEAFGENSSGETEFSFQFTGRQAIGDGLYYYRARFYDSKTGSFISQDPIGFSSGELNLYGYVGNSPHNFNDPTGNFYQVLLIPGRIVISSAIAGFQQGVADYLTTPGSHDRKLRNALGGFASAFREGLKTGVFGEPLVAAYNLISDVNDQLKEYKQRCGRAGFDVTNLRNLFYKYLPGKIVNAPQNKARGKYQKLIVQSALNNIFSYMSELISER